MKKHFKILIIIIASTIMVLSNITTTNDGFKNGSIFSFAKVDYLTAKMSLKEKIGQMLILDFRNYDEHKTYSNKTPMLSLNEDYGKALANLNIGGIILFKEACSNPNQVIELIDSAQTKRTAKNNLNSIPLLVTIDQEGGIVERLDFASTFPTNMALAATGNVEYAYSEGDIIGKELNALGINTDFAPVVDINSNPNNPIIGLRSYADNPDVVYKYASKFSLGLKNNNIISTIKHFPGHGDTAIDSHTGMPTVNKTYEELSSFELLPFKSLINEGVEMVLTAHIQYPLIEDESYYSTLKNEYVTLPATLSNKIINDTLREELGFKGVVVSDSLIMDAIDTYFTKEEATKLAINAGVDMLLMPIQIDCKEDLFELEDYINSIEKMVLNGEISEKTINKHVKRILTLKSNHNLLEYAPINLEEKIENANSIVNSKDHQEIINNIYKESITLYKNDETLPLNTDGFKKISIVYPSSSAYLPLSEGIEKIKAEGLLNETVNVEFLPYSNQSNLKSFKKLINKTDCLIIISTINNPIELDLNSTYSSKIKFVLDLINSFKNSNCKVVAISSALPYDAEYLKDADAVIMTYDSKGYFENDDGSKTSSYKMAIEKIFNCDFDNINP